MVKRQGLKSHGMFGQPGQVFPTHGLRHTGSIDISRVINQNNLFNRGELVDNSPELFLGVYYFASKKVPIGGKNYLGLDLAEAVERPFDPEVGRTRRPDGSDGGRRQHSDDGFRHVGHKAGYAVALFYPQTL